LGFSRRSFIKTAAAAGFAAARFSGLPVWAQAARRSQPCFLHTGSTFAPFAQHFVDLIEPGNDEFVAEKYAFALEDVLSAWGESLVSAASEPHAFSIKFAPELQATDLSKAATTPLRHSGRGPISSERVSFAAAETLAAAAFEQYLQGYLATLGSIEVAEMRISGIEVVGQEPLRVWTAVQYVVLGKPAENVREQRTGEWEISWRQTGENASWTVSGWTATEENRSRLAGKGFVDVTTEAFAGTPSLEAQLNHGIDYWRTVLDGACAVDIYGNNGVAVGDFDNDGFDDLYVCQPSGVPNRLYRNRKDGTFEDVTEASGVGIIDATSSAIFADLRNSGLQDLIVVRTNGPLLFLNAGDGTFHLKENAFHFANAPQGSFTAVAVADYDLDGLLDVYFCLYSFYQGLSDYQFPTPFYDAQNGPPNFLFRNRGHGIFEDVTQSTGMNQSNNRYTLACSWNDYNQDGHPDLYVVNDFGRKVLYRNNGDGTFTDVSAETGVEDQGEGMSSTWFDYDNDGIDDLYAVNMWEAAGKRVTTQKQFMPAVSDEVRNAYRRDAGGNSLLHRDRHSSKFEDVTDKSFTRVGGWNWSSGAWDMDNDGYQELYVANGFISGPSADPQSGPGKRDLSSFYWRQIVTRSIEAGGRSKGYEEAWSTINEAIRSDYTWSGRQRNNLYLNNGDGSFVESASILGLDCLEDGRAFSLADIDGDGRLEVIVKNRTAPQLRVFHNQMELTGSGIAFRLQGATSNRDAIGAVVELKTATGTQRQTVTAGSGFLSQHTKTLYFGLGETAADARTVTALVHWPGGKVEECKDLPVNCRIQVEEGKGVRSAEAFRPHAARSAGKPGTGGDDLFTPTETWLVEPIVPPDFSLADASGGTHSLASLKVATLLIFASSGCDQSTEHLRAVAAAWLKFQQGNLHVLAMTVSEQSAGAAYGPMPFPVLAADRPTRDVYNIFYRYLFERRRDIPLPTAFLLDASQNVIKVYSGGFAPERVLKDHLEAARNPASRMERALPFKGTYFGAGFHHNYFTYGVAYLQYEYLDQALSCFERAVAINPSQAGAYYNIGLIYLNKNVLDKAQANLEKAVELDPSDANAWNNLGVVNGENGDYTAAQRYFEKTLSLRPSHLLAVQNLVKLYEYQEKPDDAQRVLEAAVAAEPSSASLHVEFGLFYAGKGDFNQAESEFTETLRLQPKNAAALNGLGAIAMRRGDAVTAMKDFRACVEIAPDFDRPYLNMTALLLQSGRTQEAHELLAGYLEKHPDNEEIKEALVQVDSKR
jgi:Flp pilus assembly protein TadD/peroxiredoxin